MTGSSLGMKPPSARAGAGGTPKTSTFVITLHTPFQKGCTKVTPREFLHPRRVKYGLGHQTQRVLDVTELVLGLAVDLDVRQRLR